MRNTHQNEDELEKTSMAEKWNKCGSAQTYHFPMENFHFDNTKLHFVYIYSYILTLLSSIHIHASERRKKTNGKKWNDRKRDGKELTAFLISSDAQ